MPFKEYFFWVYLDAASRWRWRLYAPNEEILADSGQSFATKESCERNIALVKRVAPGAPIRYYPAKA
jgi:uncharacterized protein YegP (UPF0339 family)